MTNTKIDLDKHKSDDDSGSDNSSDGDSDEEDSPFSTVDRTNLLEKLVPPSILEYLSVNMAV